MGSEEVIWISRSFPRWPRVRQSLKSDSWILSSSRERRQIEGGALNKNKLKSYLFVFSHIYTVCSLQKVTLYLPLQLLPFSRFSYIFQYWAGGGQMCGPRTRMMYLSKTNLYTTLVTTRWVSVSSSVKALFLYNFKFKHHVDKCFIYKWNESFHFKLCLHHRRLCWNPDCFNYPLTITSKDFPSVCEPTPLPHPF